MAGRPGGRVAAVRWARRLWERESRADRMVDAALDDDRQAAGVAAGLAAEVDELDDDELDDDELDDVALDEAEPDDDVVVDDEELESEPLDDETVDFDPDRESVR